MTGVEKNKRRELARVKRRLEQLLPLVSKQRRAGIRRRLIQIDSELGVSSGVDAEKLIRDPRSAYGVDGIGGLEFQSQAPPGVGRLLRLPFYPVEVPGNTLTSEAAGAPAVAQISVTGVPVAGDEFRFNGVALVGVNGPRTSGGNNFDINAVPLIAEIVEALNDPANGFLPICSAVRDAGGFAFAVVTASVRNFPGTAGNGIPLTENTGAARLSIVPFAGGVDSVPSTTNPSIGTLLPHEGYVRGYRLRTEQVDWARFRLVGLEIYTRTARRLDNVGAEVGSPRPTILIKNLMVGGGANLLADEDYVDATVFSARIPEFCGLRDYPVVESPNQLTVDACISGGVGMKLSWSIHAVVDVLYDDLFGHHIPGPYGRQDAVMRRSHPDGTGFTS